jgi:D-alanine-D-alanine ligase
VGSDGLTLGLTLDKALTKKTFLADHVPTPKYFVADEKTDFQNLDSMKFPFIVKPRYEGSSKGISDESIVSDRAALQKQVLSIVRVYQQPALVEEFISGSEFTVLVIGNEVPQALPPVQIQITGLLELGDLICPPKISKELERKLCDIAVQAYRATDCRDFGRVDFRVDKDGVPFVLEVNPLPSLSSEDVFPLIAKAIGMTHGGLILKIVDIALKRCGLDERA